MKIHTFCNPLDLSYEYRVYEGDKDGNSLICLEAADPVVVAFEQEYYLFSSVTNGYWVSEDLANWSFIFCDNTMLPNICSYAPAVMVMDGAIYFHQGLHDKNLYRNKTPKNPHTWELVTDNCYLGHDPFLYYDEVEDRVWASFGCGPGETEYIKVVELDRHTLEPMEQIHECIHYDPAHRGWERCFDNHTGVGGGWTEGSQILRHGNKWYLIYSGFSLHKGYANGVYISDSPTGPYEYAPNNPISHKNTGFVGGAGHGCLFGDRNGNWWNVTCASVYVSHMFERRINLFPAGFDEDGYLYVNTALGDYPIALPRGTRDHRTLTPPYMLLSKGCPVTVSSIETAMPEHPSYGGAVTETEVPESRYDHSPRYIVDEDIRTLWAADSRASDQWAMVDLGTNCTVNAIQLNIPTYNLLTTALSEKYHAYRIEISQDGTSWKTLAETETTEVFSPHAYYEVEGYGRYVKVTFRHVAGNGFAALSGLRIFGSREEDKPASISDITVIRDPDDLRNATVCWDPAERAEGYIVRYGISSDKLYNQYQVYGTSAEIRTLTVGIEYWFRIDSFNAQGITVGKRVKQIS